MALKIPESHLEGIGVVRSLNDIQAATFASEIDSGAGAAHGSGQDFAEHHQIPGLDAAQVAKGFTSLKELYRVREHEHMSVDEFASEIIGALNATERKDLAVSEDERKDFKQRFAKLLSARAFGIEAKADDLQKDFEHLYCQSRVLTDLRPVFEDDVSTGPVRMLITHTMRIGYHDYGDHKEIYVALSDSQVQRLIDQLRRAQEKARLLSNYVTGDKKP